GEAVYWLETRPSEDGRDVVVRWTADAGVADAVPARFDVGSQVHEYGGGAYLPVGGTLFACNQGDQRLYRIDGSTIRCRSLLCLRGRRACGTPTCAWCR